MDNRTFNASQISSVNYDMKYGCQNWITTVSNSSNGEYKLYATGDADLNGRKYVALPANKKVTDEDRRKYNIW